MKKQLQSYLLFGILIFLTTDHYSQTLAGMVLDNNNLPVESATILLVQNVDSAFVLGAISDEDGSYFFSHPPEGDYRISASKLGYETMWSPSFSFVKDETRVENLKLREVAVALDAITVSASRPLYQREVDRTVINVQSNVVNKNSSVLEVLSRSPGVVVNKQTGNISMSGKSGVRIMINGKMMRVPLSDLIHMLDGINAINVEKIELITAPPSKC